MTNRTAKSTAYSVIVRDTRGVERIVYRTDSHDDALCFEQEYHLGAQEHTIRVQDNATA